ncbi:MAG: ferrous iron transport protein A [Gemmatimonadales bacterium]
MSPLRSLWSRIRRRATPSVAPPSCGQDCPLGDCTSGLRAMVVCVTCPEHEARRLRALGVFVGARVGIVDTRNGILLDVCGSRLALDAAIAMAITVLPIA